MAKRANPFLEDFVQQSKVHVGMKQFNNNEDRLKKVYEKTLELLFKGAKKPPAQDPAANSENVSSTKKDGKKQLFIGKDGTLLYNGKMADNKVVAVQQCACGSTGESGCAYCERALCTGCQHPCDRCQRLYCSHCSLIGSEGSEVCVSCYS